MKIIILSVTGNLNNKFSSVFNPVEYFSMTANGQLFLTEVLFQLDSLIENVVFVNTDGFTIGIKNTNVPLFKNNLDKIAEKQGFLFDTQTKITAGLLFSVNSYICIKEDAQGNESVVVKGFEIGDFDIVTKFLIFVVKQKWDCFEKNKIIPLLINFLKEHKIPENFQDFLGYEKRNTDRVLYFFSKKPTFFGGMPVGGIIKCRDFPVSVLNFSDSNFISENKNILNFLCDNLDLVSYARFVLNKLLNLKLLDKKDLLNLKASDFTEAFPKEEFYNQSAILNKAHKLSTNIGLYLIPKISNKKSITGFRENTKLIELLPPQSFWEKEFEDRFYFWLYASTISMNIEKSFPKICFDFDDTSPFYKKDRTNKQLLFLIAY
jgi:hypothetical protein